jgi:hypothetical protein
MRASCPSSQVTANGRPLTVKLICPTSSPFPQDTTDTGQRPIDTRSDLFDLRAVGFVTGPVGPTRSLEPGYRPLEPLDR